MGRQQQQDLADIAVFFGKIVVVPALLFWVIATPLVNYLSFRQHAVPVVPIPPGSTLVASQDQPKSYRREYMTPLSTEAVRSYYERAMATPERKRLDWLGNIALTSNIVRGRWTCAHERPMPELGRQRSYRTPQEWCGKDSLTVSGKGTTGGNTHLTLMLTGDLHETARFAEETH